MAGDFHRSEIDFRVNSPNLTPVETTTYTCVYTPLLTFFPGERYGE